MLNSSLSINKAQLLRTSVSPTQKQTCWRSTASAARHRQAQHLWINTLSGVAAFASTVCLSCARCHEATASTVLVVFCTTRGPMCKRNSQSVQHCLVLAVLQTRCKLHCRHNHLLFDFLVFVVSPTACCCGAATCTSSMPLFMFHDVHCMFGAVAAIFIWWKVHASVLCFHCAAHIENTAHGMRVQQKPHQQQRTKSFLCPADVLCGTGTNECVMESGVLNHALCWMAWNVWS